MQKVILIDEEAQVKNKTISMERLKTDFKCMFDLLEKYFPKGKKVEGEEEPLKKPTVREFGIFYDRLPKEKKEIFLQELFEARVGNEEAAEKKGLAALPDDVKGIINMSQEKWDKLAKERQELILEKFIQLQI